RPRSRSSSACSESRPPAGGHTSRVTETRETVTASVAETETVAGRLVRQLRAGDVVGLSGELGSGKTTFVRGAARALGVTEPVSSPTFTIGHRYDASPPVA